MMTKMCNLGTADAGVDPTMTLTTVTCCDPVSCCSNAIRATACCANAQFLVPKPPNAEFIVGYSSAGTQTTDAAGAITYSPAFTVNSATSSTGPPSCCKLRIS